MNISCSLRVCSFFRVDLARPADLIPPEGPLHPGQELAHPAHLRRPHAQAHVEDLQHLQKAREVKLLDDKYVKYGYENGLNA